MKRLSNFLLSFFILLTAACDQVEYFPEKSPDLSGVYRGNGVETITDANGNTQNIFWEIRITVSNIQSLDLSQPGESPTARFAITRFALLNNVTDLPTPENIDDKRTFRLTHNAISRQVVLDGAFGPFGTTVKGTFEVKDLLYGERMGEFELTKVE